MPKKRKPKSTKPKSQPARSSRRRLSLTQGNQLNFQQLEDRHLLAAITVTNATDLTNADTSSVEALIAADGGDGISLREAITASNNTAGEHTITFDESVFTGGANSLIRLTQGELEITDTLTVNASAATNVTISGDANGDDILVDGTFVTDVDASSGLNGYMLSDNSRVINFTDDLGMLSLSNILVTGGRAIDDGGGILSLGGAVTLNSSIISGNLVGERGGGINILGGSLSLIDSDVSENRAFSFNSRGGGVYSSLGSVTLTNSSINGNEASDRGGGIALDNADLSLTNSTVSGNRLTRNWGGGIYSSLGSVTLTDSVISDNSADRFGGGIFTIRGSASLIDSTITGNVAGDEGGGVLIHDGSLFLTNSTVNANSSDSVFGEGGGIFSSRSSTFLTNSTVTGNDAGRTGGGLHARGGLVSLINSTVAGNSAANGGGGVFAENFSDEASDFEIFNSIISGNTDNGTAPNFQPAPDGTLTVNHSLIGDTTGSGITATTGVGNILNQPALLGPLADNGGPTLTHALLEGSPAIDGGSDTFAVDADDNPLTTDQRGDGFDRVNFGRPDIGAFESDFDAPPIAPAVLSATIDEGGVLARPDLWNTLTVVFDAEVTVSAVDLSLVNDSTGGNAVDLTGIGFSFDSSTNAATWDFGSLATPLDAAFYTYQLDADAITYEGLALDANGDGTGGDDFLGQHYVAIPGDANLDGVVDVLNDAFALVGNLGSTTNFAWADGNFNGDGVLSVLGDAFTLVGNLGRDVRPPVALPASAAASAATARFAFNTSNDADDQNEAAKDAKLAALPQPRSLALAGDHELRDDVFGSDF